MSDTPPTTPPRHRSISASYTLSPSTITPSSPLPPAPISVDVTYRIVRIKPTYADWLIPDPSDIIQIIGPVTGPIANTSDDCEEQEAGDDRFEIPCAARLTWGDRSIHWICLYYPSAFLFTDFGRCIDEAADAADEVERVRSVRITMQDAIFSGEDIGGEMVEYEDMRDDDGNAFMVLHVNQGLGGSARLYCKKITDS